MKNPISRLIGIGALVGSIFGVGSQAFGKNIEINCAGGRFGTHATSSLNVSYVDNEPTKWSSTYVDTSKKMSYSFAGRPGEHYDAFVLVQGAKKQIIFTTSFGYDLVRFVATEKSGVLKIKSLVSNSYTHGGPEPVLSKIESCDFSEETRALIGELLK